jgi:hypothetical protein
MTRRLLAALTLVLCCTLPLHGDFRSLDRALRDHLGDPVWIPFSGLARFATWVARPDGVRDFQLTVFEGKRHASIDGAEVERLLRAEAPEFRPMVHVRSDKRGEWTFIYTRPAGRDLIEMLIVTHDDDTVLLRLEMDVDTFARECGSPAKMARLAKQ